MLVDYILKAADLQYGLNLNNARLLAYQFAKANNKKVPAHRKKTKLLESTGLDYSAKITITSYH